MSKLNYHASGCKARSIYIDDSHCSCGLAEAAEEAAYESRHDVVINNLGESADEERLRLDSAEYWRGKCEEAEQTAAERVGADPEVRDLLLREFGTTDPELIKGEVDRLKEQSDRFKKALLKIESCQEGKATMKFIARAVFMEGSK